MMMSLKESHAQTQRDTHRAYGHVKTGSDQSDVATTQGMPKTAKSHWKLGTRKERLSPRAVRESKALPTP